MYKKKYSIVCAVNDEKVLLDNLLRSPEIYSHEIILQSYYDNVCKAYNDAAPTNDIVIYVHQDVYLPLGFFDLLTFNIHLDNWEWGVLGVAGRNKDKYLGHILDRGQIFGTEKGLPAKVQTLDELLLVMHKDAFKFDEYIPHHHLFGTDLCMQAASIGKNCYAINAYCEHNSTQGYSLDNKFALSRNYIRNKWWHMLPIYSTCTVIEKHT